MKVIAIMTMLVLAMFAFSPMVLAEENVTEEDAGITPDSPLYGLDKAIERIQMALIFDDVKRAEKALEHAEERLAEVKIMIEQKKLDKADKAREGHEEDLNEAQEAIDNIETDEDEEESEKALENTLGLERRMLSHREKIALVHNRILARLAENPNVSEEQLAHLTEVFGKIDAKSAEVEVKINEKRSRIRLKHKVLTGLTDEELDELEADLAERQRKRFERIRERRSADSEDELEIEIEEEFEDDSEDEDSEDDEESDETSA